MAESKTMLTSLSRLNYTTWKVQCKMALMKEGVWKIVDGTETAPRADDAGYAKFVERRDRALAIVVLAIDPALLYLIGEPTDPTEDMRHDTLLTLRTTLPCLTQYIKWPSHMMAIEEFKG